MSILRRRSAGTPPACPNSFMSASTSSSAGLRSVAARTASTSPSLVSFPPSPMCTESSVCIFCTAVSCASVSFELLLCSSADSSCSRPSSVLGAHSLHGTNNADVSDAQRAATTRARLT